MDVLSPTYAKRLEHDQGAPWKRWLDVQAPYRWNLRRLSRGKTLDVGCGVGRNLRNLEGRGIGVDANEACVAIARANGFEAYTPDTLPDETFDTLLVSHVLEHLNDPAQLVAQYLPRLSSSGDLILITPQEAGYASDPTHLRFLDLDALKTICLSLGFTVEKAFSFPFPRWAGQLFKYNEFVVTARRTDVPAKS